MKKHSNSTRKAKKTSQSSPQFFRPVWTEINHKNLKENFQKVAHFVDDKVDFLCVVKANGYGHGIVPIARTLSTMPGKRPAFFGVTSIEESMALIDNGIKTPSLVLGNIYPFTNLEYAIQNRIHLTIASETSAKMCDHYARKTGAKVYAHAKIDTGMSRIGVSIQNAEHFIKKILSYRTIQLEGVYTHFSDSADDTDFTNQQFALFANLIKKLKAEGINIPYVHCANSAAIVKYPKSHFNLVRTGISLYGSTQLKKQEIPGLKPVLSWKSRIVFLKDVPAGVPVSYARTYITQKKSRIATAAFGYADGFRRSLSNNAEVLAGGKRVPVVGRVTMDMTMLDVTHAPHVKVGDEVVLIGTQGNETISVEEVARWEETSPYEVFCSISARVPRVDIY